MTNHIWKYIAACILASVIGSNAFAQGAKLAVINTAGEVWARDLDLSGGNVGEGVKLTGPGLFGGPDDRFVVASGHSIAVITTSGAFWPRVVGENNTIGPGFKTSGSLFGGPNAKYVLYDYGCSKVYVVNTNGEVWAHSVPFQNGDVGIGRKLNGPSLFGDKNDKYVVLDGPRIGLDRPRILVINTQGEVWAHDILSRNRPPNSLGCDYDTVGGGYKLTGPSLFGGPNDKYVLSIDGYILVINTLGEVWSRRLSQTAVGLGVKLNGPGLFGGANDKYVVTYHEPPPPPK
jgi:hypothetical protein